MGMMKIFILLFFLLLFFVVTVPNRSEYEGGANKWYGGGGVSGVRSASRKVDWKALMYNWFVPCLVYIWLPKHHSEHVTMMKNVTKPPNAPKYQITDHMSTSVDRAGSFLKDVDGPRRP
uniref:Uncharacterized protein n=1 Tax=Clastoptera arizonana TaxID=38151 RepID=A0A1B6CIJ0_9HEMI